MFWFVTALVALVGNVVLQLLDIWTTVLTLEAGAREQNPFSHSLMQAFGVEAWVAVKGLLVVGLVAAIIYVVRVRDDKDALKTITYPATAIMVWMGGVIANNLRVMGLI